MKIEDIKEKRVAIHCPTEKESELALKIIGLPLGDSDTWSTYGCDACLAVGFEMVVFISIDSFKGCRWIIVSASSFIKANS